MTRPSWLGRAVRNWHHHAIEQASRRWRGGRHDDSARTRRKILISTQVPAEWKDRYADVAWVESQGFEHWPSIIYDPRWTKGNINTSATVWKSTSATGAPDNSSLSHFSAMTRPSWLGRAVRNRHRHAIEQASCRWRGGRRDDSAQTRRQILISTQATTCSGTRRGPPAPRR